MKKMFAHIFNLKLTDILAIYVEVLAFLSE